MVKTLIEHIPGNPRTNKGVNPVNYIVFHETANTSRGANARAHANLQARGGMPKNSWHIQVDDNVAIESYPDTARCWHAGNAKGNNEGLGIEICVNSDGNHKKAVENAAEIGAAKMRKNNVPIERAVQHNFFSGKDCPHFMRNGGLGGYTWNAFKELLRANLNGGIVTPPKEVIIPGKVRRELRRGANGEDVKILQRRMNEYKYTPDRRWPGGDIRVDGDFGSITEARVRDIQKRNGLYVDGIAGRKTLAFLKIWGG